MTILKTGKTVKTVLTPAGVHNAAMTPARGTHLRYMPARG